MSGKKIVLLVALNLSLISIGLLLILPSLSGIIKVMRMRRLKIDSNICSLTKSAECAEKKELLDMMTGSTPSPKALNGLQMPSPYPLRNQ